MSQKLTFNQTKELLLDQETIEVLFPSAGKSLLGMLKALVNDLEVSFTTEDFLVSDLSKARDVLSILKMVLKALFFETLSEPATTVIRAMVLLCTNYLNILDLSSEEIAPRVEAARDQLSRIDVLLNFIFTSRSLIGLMQTFMHEYQRMISFKPGVLGVSEKYLETFADAVKNRDKQDNYSFKNLRKQYAPTSSTNLQKPSDCKEKKNV